MPSYPTDSWDDEAEAWDYLASLGFTQHRSVIRPPSPDFDFGLYPKSLSEAINYLCGEWDWAYDGH